MYAASTDAMRGEPSAFAAGPKLPDASSLYCQNMPAGRPPVAPPGRLSPAPAAYAVDATRPPVASVATATRPASTVRAGPAPCAPRASGS